LAIAVAALVQSVLADIQVAGLPPSLSYAVGVYQADGEVNSHTKYNNLDKPNLWLSMDSLGFWALQSTENLGTSNDILISLTQNIGDPTIAGPWKVWSTDKWILEPSVTVVTIPEPEAQLSLLVVAMTIFCLLVLISFILSITGSKKKTTRSAIFIFLCYSMLVIITGLLSKAVVAELALLLPAVFADDSVFQGFALWGVFTIFYISLQLLAYKCQYSRRRLLAVSSFGAFLVGFFGIHAVGSIAQEVANFAIGDQASDPSQQFTAKLVGCCCGLVLVWFLLSLYRGAMTADRDDRKYKPPTSPWPQPRVRSPECARLCTSASMPAQPLILRGDGTGSDKDAPLPDWCDIVEEAENKVHALVVSYGISQTFMYALFEVYPKLFDSNEWPEGDSYGKWALAILIPIIFQFVAMVLGGGSSISPSVKRTFHILKVTFAFTSTWCFWRFIALKVVDILAKTTPAAGLCTAVACTFIGLLMLVIVSKLVDPEAMSTEKSRDFAEDVVKVNLYCMGLLVGLTLMYALYWNTLTFVNAYILQDLDQPRGHAFHLFLLIVATVLTIPWARAILPRAEMPANEHEESILEEAKEWGESLF